MNAALDTAADFLELLFGADAVIGAPAFDAAAEAARVEAAKASIGAALNTKLIRGTCRRCAGTGNIFAFAHRQGGVCFACGGTGN